MAAEGMGFVLAIAGIFTSCVDAFGYFKAGQHLEQDYEILLVKLDIEKTRLLCWGNTVGILDDIQHHKMLEDESVAELLQRCLKNIERLLTDSEELRKCYGIRNSVISRDRAIDFLSSNNMSLFSIACSRFRARHASGNPRPTLVSRTKWAIYDQNKFEHLINNLKALIDGLYEILHLDRETQDNIIVADIGLVRDLSQLRLLDAASEGSYRTYSNAAKSVIAASEMGTADNRNGEERLGDVEAPIHSSLPASWIPGGLSSTTDLDSLLTELRLCEKHIVLTGHCQKSQSGESCEMAELGAKCVVGNPVFLEAFPFNIASRYEGGGSALWQLITNIVDIRSKLALLTEESELMTKLLRDDSGSLDDYQRDFLKAMLPVATAYIHCAPCISLIHTALEISKRGSSSLLRIAVRPDDRIASSCCYDIDRTDGLRSILSNIKRHETIAATSHGTLGYFQPPEASRHLDRAWIEQRLHCIEQERNYDVKESRDSHTIILGEAKYLLSLLQKAPGPKVPRESEIWELSLNGSHDNREFVGSFTPKQFPMSPQASTTIMQQAPVTKLATTSHRPEPPSPPASKRFKGSATSMNAEDNEGNLSSETTPA